MRTVFYQFGFCFFIVFLSLPGFGQDAAAPAPVTPAPAAPVAEVAPVAPAAPAVTRAPDPELRLNDNAPSASSLSVTVVNASRRSEPVRAVTGVSSPVVSTLDAPVAPGKQVDLIGIAPSASSGRASGEELMDRPFLRRGELLEVVPGLIVTQHSGGGKANQYFLRGYNLDHGTDFAIFVDNMPVNNRSHAHGQGYADINFLIPELVEELEYVKGPYFSQFGDFSTAGAARFRLYRELPEGIANFSIGTNNYYRGLLADSVKAGDGVATYALEYNYYDGPWVNPDELNRINGFFRYFEGDEADFFAVTAMGFDSTWNGTDQIPLRAIQSGALDRFGFVDPTNGGDTSRYSLSADFRSSGDDGVTSGSVYAGSYSLNLFSNFTYFLDDPFNGDQFNQVDNRRFAGASIEHTFDDLQLFDRDSTVTVGATTHHDWIEDIGLHKTSSRQRVSTVREDDIYEASFSTHGNAKITWNDWLRTETGLRADLFHFDVDARSLPENSGEKWDGIISPKAGLVLGPWNDTEFYLNGGLGFHSNDARGVVISVDPEDGVTPLPRAPGLVRTRGAEFGIRNQTIENLTSTAAVWYLHSDSELVYIGDAGTVEAGDASERYGFEWSNYWKPQPWLQLDTEFTLTESRFIETGEEIENMIPVSFSGGINFGREEGVFAGLRARYFSPRPLNGDGSVESQDALQFNSRLGYRTSDNWEVALEVINLFDANDNDIEYFYESQLPGEAASVEDHHIHPYEPRQLRLGITKRW